MRSIPGYKSASATQGKSKTDKHAALSETVIADYSEPEDDFFGKIKK